MEDKIKLAEQELDFLSRYIYDHLKGLKYSIESEIEIFDLMRKYKIKYEEMGKFKYVTTKAILIYLKQQVREQKIEEILDGR